MRLFHTIINLKIRQIIFLIKYRIIKPFFKNFNTNYSGKYIQFINDDSCEIAILNKRITFNGDFNWFDKKYDKLLLYNLHYFNFINKENSKKINFFQLLILNWIDNSKFQYSIAFDSYPTSIRLINWIIFLKKNKIYDSAIFDSIKAQAQNLKKNIEYHLDANHLLTNFICIIYLINFNKDYKKIFNKIFFYELFIKELNKQILNDGGHYERSPSYHLYLLNDLVNLIEYLEKNTLHNDKLIKFVLSKIILMNNWSLHILHEDLNVPFFNDSNFNKDLNILKLMDKIKILKLKFRYQISKTHNNSFIQLKDTGYYIYTNDNFKLISSMSNVIPNFQPGHAHANTLSFELSLNSHRLFVNSGVNTYNYNRNRLFQRSTAAQNTIEINNKNSSDVWGSFRVGKRAKISNFFSKISKKSVSFGSTHNGYSTIFNKLLHRREFNIGNDYVIIYDEILGSFNKAILRFYLHPDVTLKKNKLIMNNKILIFETSNEYTVNESEWYPEFNNKKLNKNIAIILDNKKNTNTFKLII